MVPRIPNATLRRAPLLDRLNASLECRLILLAATAGYGKSALLSHWVEELSGPLAWVSCTEVDGGGEVLWRRLSSAVGEAWAPDGILGAEVDGADDRSSAPLALCERLRQVGTPGVVVIDDFHLSRVAPAEMVAFVAGLPPGVRLVLATRVDPPFSLARMRLQGTLLELRQPDLMFSLEEAREVLVGMDARVGEEEALSLHQLTEGWPAAVHLLGLSLRGRTDHAAVLGDAWVQDRNLADFLLNEVVDRQRPELREFLMLTAELESFDVALCDEVTGRSDGARLLDEVRAANLFLVETSDGTVAYRYHHLFGEFLRLRMRLQAGGADDAVAVHRKAAAALSARGDRASAVRHHLAGNDVDAARELLSGQITAALSVDLDGGALVARRWLAEYGERDLVGDPSALLECTMALHVGGAVDEAELWLRRWSEREPDLDHGARVLLHGALSFHHVFVGDPAAALDEALVASRLIEAAAVDDRWSDALLVLLLQAQWWLGDNDGVRATVAAGLQRASLPAPLALVRLPSYLAMADLEEGELHRAEESASRAIEAADLLSLPEHNFGRAEPELVLAAVFTERGLFEQAAERLEKVMRICEVRRPALEVQAHLLLARLADACGDREGADLCVERARSAQPRASAVVTARIDEVAGRRCLARGDLAGAARHLAAIPDGRRADLLAGRIALAQGDQVAALARFDAAAAGAHVRRARIEAGLPRVLALPRSERERAARDLAEVLGWTESAGFRRSVVEEGPQMWDLLAEVPAVGRVAAHVDALLADARRELPAPQRATQDSLIDPLSERELTVLRYLASRLDSTEIAAALYLSVNTVRSHVKAIYRKLAVNSRPAAVARATELDLL